MNFIKSDNLNVLDFSKNVGIPHDRIYAWRRGRGNPKPKDLELVQKWLNERDSILKKNDGSNRDNTGALPINSMDILIKAIADLVESNKALAQTNREQWLRINSSETASASSSDEVAGGLIRKTIEYGEHPLDKSVQESDSKGQKPGGTYSKTNK